MNAAFSENLLINAIPDQARNHKRLKIMYDDTLIDIHKSLTLCEQFL